MKLLVFLSFFISLAANGSVNSITHNYFKPITGELFEIKAGETLTILTTKPVKILTKKIIINGVLIVKERIYQDDVITIKGHSIHRKINKGKPGESVNGFKGSLSKYGHGGSGASSVQDGLSPELTGSQFTVLKGETKTIAGGKGGLSGFSGGVLLLDSDNITINGKIILKGEKGLPGMSRQTGKISLINKCKEYECCLENGSKGECLEVGMCKEKCNNTIDYIIGAGGRGGDGIDGYLFIKQKYKNLKIDVKNIIYY